MKKRNLFIIIGAVVLCGALTVGVIAGKNSREKVTVVGIYDINPDWQSTIKEIFEKDTTNKYEYKELTEKDIQDIKLTNKIDLLITKNGASVQRLKIQANPLSSDVLQRIPQTIKKSELYTLEDGETTVVQPLVIDNFEMAVLKTAINRYEIPVPTTIEEISKFAHTATYYYPIPLLIAGSSDENISSLLSNLVISYGGYDGYKNVVKQLQTTTDFSTIFDYKIGGDADVELKLSDLLAVIKSWQDKMYLPQNWLQLTPYMSENLIDDNRIAISFMTLTEHRSKPQPNISYYTELEFPVETAKTVASVQPVYVALSFTDSEGVRIALNRLSLSDSQERLSLITKLGPAMLQGTSCDIQADDARFKAATAEAGPVPDLGTAAFEKETDRHAFAEAVRNWF